MSLVNKVVAANWKMHHGPSAVGDFFLRFSQAAPESVRVLVFPPAVSLPAAVAAAPAVELGVQNVHWEKEGALTGETSAEMAREAGATLALVGHSERRHLFGETDAETGRKAAAAVRAGLAPVVCVGELLEERRAGQLRHVLARQLEAVAGPLADAARTTGFMVAYEPVWAIGTGETATPRDAAEAHGIVREVLDRSVASGDPGGATEVPVLYGGSVNPGNAGTLMSAPGVDGVLVGGASLDPESLAAIARAAAEATSSAG